MSKTFRGLAVGGPKDGQYLESNMAKFEVLSREAVHLMGKGHAVALPATSAHVVYSYHQFHGIPLWVVASNDGIPDVAAIAAALVVHYHPVQFLTGETP